MNFAQCFRDPDDNKNVRIEFSGYTFVVVAIHKRLHCLDCIIVVGPSIGNAHYRPLIFYQKKKILHKLKGSYEGGKNSSPMTN